VYLIFDQFFDWASILEDIAERPYITVGFAAWLLLIPLAITSTNGMMKRLGRRWQRLHRLVYLIGLLGVLHYLWLVKTDFTRTAAVRRAVGCMYAGLSAVVACSLSDADPFHPLKPAR
jgi:DMSO/TMAO reductase YedYZ heme-binding membrane subunit